MQTERIEELRRENAALLSVILGAHVVAQHNGMDSRRYRWNGGCWLHKGDTLLRLNLDAIDAARKAAKP